MPSCFDPEMVDHPAVHKQLVITGGCLGAAAAAVRRRFGADPTYSRVDLVAGPTGTPAVLEVELIDPRLSLDMEPAAAMRMARAILAI